MDIAGNAPAGKTVDPGPALRIIEEMSPVTAGDIIPLLQRLQEEYGYLPRELVLDLCERAGLPASRVFGVATFYSQFCLKPRGRHLVRCCRGTACHVRGGRRVLESVERALGICDGETTKDMLFSIETVACLGACALSPVMVIDKTYHGKMTPRRAEQLLHDMAKGAS